MRRSCKGQRSSHLLGFANALFGLKLIQEDTLSEMINPGLDDYGYGVWCYDTEVNGKKYRVVKRPGQIMGAQTQLYHFMDLDLNDCHSEQYGNNKSR